VREAIICGSDRGPNFLDLWIWDNGNGNSQGGTNLGCSYPNDTGLAGEKVFTGSNHFQVKEIEMFKITS
jgi:hypothetical protein